MRWRPTRGSPPMPAGWRGVTLVATAPALLVSDITVSGNARLATGEVLPRYATHRDSFKKVEERQAWYRPSRRREQLLAQIITNDAQAVAETIMNTMARGVTRLEGTGMYTGEVRPVLICAITATEASQLKHLVNEVDPDAMVIVMPAREILGKGFGALA